MSEASPKKYRLFVRWPDDVLTVRDAHTETELLTITVPQLVCQHATFDAARAALEKCCRHFERIYGEGPQGVRLLDEYVTAREVLKQMEGA